MGGGLLGFLCCGVGAGMKGTGATATCTDEASTPGPTVTGECGVGAVAGAAQQQAAAEHEQACGRGGCGWWRGVRGGERAKEVGACVMAGRSCAPFQQGERAAGVGARRRLCEGMRVR